MYKLGGSPLGEFNKEAAHPIINCCLHKTLERLSIIMLSPAHMTYHLFNPSTLLCRKFSRQFWAKALELAGFYGWQPIGTYPTPNHDFCKLNAVWDGSYFTNDGQIVIAEDALSLAAALERALDDIPDANIKIDWNSQSWLEDDLPEWLSPAERALIEEGLQDGLLDILGIHPFEFFAGDEKHHLIQFIRFCRLGSFEIL